MSTAKQDLSLDGQRKVIVDWAASAGVDIVAWFEDPARSGATHPKRRQGLLDALRALETLRAGVLVVAADDRLSRDTNHAGWIATEVDDLGAVVVDASKPEAEWIAKMFGRMNAQSYLESLRKNTLRAMAVKKARGERVGSIPFGYILAEDGIHLNSHPVEQPVLINILGMRRAGMGGRRIATTLAVEGHQPRGAAWNPGNLQVMADKWLSGELPVDLKEGLERWTVQKGKGAVAATMRVPKAAPSPSPRRMPDVRSGSQTWCT